MREHPAGSAVLSGLRGAAASDCLHALIGPQRPLLSLRENRNLRLAGTRYGIPVALLCLRQNRPTSIACAEAPALIAKILGHVRAREASVGLEARAPPVDRTDELKLR